MASSIWLSSALRHKILDIIVGNRKLKIVTKNLLKLPSIDRLFVILVEQFEAVSGLLLVSKHFRPSELHGVFKESVIGCILLPEIRVVFGELLVGLLL